MRVAVAGNADAGWLHAAVQTGLYGVELVNVFVKTSVALFDYRGVINCGRGYGNRYASFGFGDEIFALAQSTYEQNISRVELRSLSCTHGKFLLEALSYLKWRMQ